MLYITTNFTNITNLVLQNLFVKFDIFVVLKADNGLEHSIPFLFNHESH